MRGIPIGVFQVPPFIVRFEKGIFFLVEKKHEGEESITIAGSNADWPLATEPPPPKDNDGTVSHLADFKYQSSLVALWSRIRTSPPPPQSSHS